MRAFEHYTPRSLPEAFELITRLNGQASIIAGGTDLLLKMRAGELSPAVLINIKELRELKGIHYNGQTGLKIGALTTLRELTRTPAIREHYPSLESTARLMASEQIRSFATLGGNLCNAAPSADLAPPLIALDGNACLVGPAGEREIPLQDFFLGSGKTALEEHELLKAIHIPVPDGDTTYIKHSPRAFMDIAVVGVAIRLRLDEEICKEIRIVLGAVAPTPLRAYRAEAELSGHPCSLERIKQAALVAAEACSPIDDVRGAAWYRKRMVEVLVERGLTSFRNGEYQ